MKAAVPLVKHTPGVKCKLYGVCGDIVKIKYDLCSQGDIEHDLARSQFDPKPFSIIITFLP